ncbi:MAG TPA: VOC family protein [Oculatellaceae cyanobacterium]
MAKTKHPIPPHLRSVTPNLTIKNAKEAMDFYVKAFGAEIVMSMSGPDGKLMHGEVKIGDSVIFIHDECEQMDALGPSSRGGATGGLIIYSEDADAMFDRAVKAGCSVKMPVADQFWGDRYGCVADPFGHVWSVATHVEDLTPAEIESRRAVAMKEMAAAK